jgi:hypothetical protein
MALILLNDRVSPIHLAASLRQRPMLNDLCARLLLLLSLSPFTAPFSTCDLAILLGHAARHTNTATHALSGADLTLTDNDGPSMAPTSSRIARPERLRLFKRLQVDADPTSNAIHRAVNTSAGVECGQSPSLRAPFSSLTTSLRL